MKEQRGNVKEIRQRPARVASAKKAPATKFRLPVRQAILDRRTYEAPAEGRANKLRLDFNENTSGCSAAVRKALAKITAKELAMYPEYQVRTASIARQFGVHPEEIMLANGGDDALRVFFDTFVEPRTSILVCEPTFPMYRYFGEIAGANIAVLKYDSEMQFPLRAALAALAEKPRVLFIANPNNPTGTLLSRDALRQILEAATHTAVVIDEAYAEFSGATLIPWIRKYPHLFIVRTFSKAAGLAALRLGVVIAGKTSLALLRRAMPPFPINIAALVAADAALHDRATIQRYVAQTLRLRKNFAAQLSKLGVKTFPSAGNFLLADFGATGPALFASLAREGILVRERAKEFAPGYVRISIGTPQEMRRVTQAITRYMKNPGKKSL